MKKIKEILYYALMLHTEDIVILKDFVLDHFWDKYLKLTDFYWTIDHCTLWHSKDKETTKSKKVFSQLNSLFKKIRGNSWGYAIIEIDAIGIFNNSLVFRIVSTKGNIKNLNINFYENNDLPFASKFPYIEIAKYKENIEQTTSEIQWEKLKNSFCVNVRLSEIEGY